jgi:hypothetical protein
VLPSASADTSGTPRPPWFVNSHIWPAVFACSVQEGAVSNGEMPPPPPLHAISFWTFPSLSATL